jgi:hypothetical protein
MRIIRRKEKETQRKKERKWVALEKLAKAANTLALVDIDKTSNNF